jgi:hypothetical protein
MQLVGRRALARTAIADRTDDEARGLIAAEVARVARTCPLPPDAASALTALEAGGVAQADVLALLDSGMRASVERLGTGRLRDRLVAAAATSLFRGESSQETMWRDHGWTTAAVVRVIGRRLDLRGADDLFLAGLLHDVGKLHLIQTGVFDYRQVPPSALTEPNAVHAIERETLGYDHAALGAALLRSWSIPDPIPLVVGWHHQPLRAYAGGGTTAALVAALRVADAIAWFFANTTTPTPKLLRLVSRSPDAEWLSLGRTQLEQWWPEMVAARAEMLALVGRTQP